MPASVFDFKEGDQSYAPERWVILPFDQLCLFLTRVARLLLGAATHRTSEWR